MRTVKYVLVLLLFSLVVAASQSKRKVESSERWLGGGKKAKIVWSDGWVAKVKIEGCSYIWIRTPNGDSITHMGNCENHKR